MENGLTYQPIPTAVMYNILRDLPEVELLLDLHSTQGGWEVAAPSVQVVHDGVEHIRISKLKEMRSKHQRKYSKPSTCMATICFLFYMQYINGMCI
jgi:hypothetical protein